MTDHDSFFDEVYEATTAPFLSPELARREVDAFLTLARVREGARVVDLGCGSGRHLPLLRERGLRPLGVDRSAPLLRLAARTGAPLVRADVRALPLRGESIDGVACFYSSMFFFDDIDNQRALAEVARVVAPGGAFVLETANPLHLKRLGEEARTFDLPGGGRVAERSRFDAATGRELGERTWSSATGEVRTGSYEIRHYAPGELEVMGLRCGLKLEQVCGDLERSPFARDSRELVVSMRKR